MWYSSTSHTGRALATRVAPFDDVSYVLVVASVGGGGGGGGGGGERELKEFTPGSTVFVF